MTTILLCSDFHTGFHADNGKGVINGLHKDGVDIAVVAGDMSAAGDTESSLVRLCDKYPHVIFVAGNHDYYGSTFAAVDKYLRNLEGKISNLTVLENDRVSIKGLNFIGATLWFASSQAAKTLKHGLNDFRYITNCDPIAFDRNDETIKYFYANIQKGDIVITHHLPSYNSVGSHYIGSPLNCYFANHLDSLIIDKEPLMWLHGHTHDPCDYVIGNTRIVCNPLGYPSEASSFNDALTIEV